MNGQKPGGLPTLSLSQCLFEIPLNSAPHLTGAGISHLLLELRLHYKTEACHFVLLERGAGKEHFLLPFLGLSWQLAAVDAGVGRGMNLASVTGEAEYAHKLHKQCLGVLWTEMVMEHHMIVPYISLHPLCLQYLASTWQLEMGAGLWEGSHSTAACLEPGRV